jgi:hypothetical protein
MKARFTVHMVRTYHEAVTLEVEAGSAEEAAEAAHRQEGAVSFDWNQVTYSEREVRGVYNATGTLVFSAEQDDVAAAG